MEDTRQQILNRLIVLQWRQGKREGLETLVQTWEQPLFYYVRRLVEQEEDAWDVMQDVWLRVFRGIGSLRNPDVLGPWLYRIARNTAFSHLRKTPRWEPLDDLENTADESADEPQFSASEIHEALGKLSLLDRDVLTLHYLEGYLLTEIAEIADAPLGTIKSRIARARKNMRAILEREGRRS